MPYPQHDKPFFLDEKRCIRIGPGAYLRSDKMVGLTVIWRHPETSAALDWYTIEQIAERARVSPAQITARIRARWAHADLIKPDGWERVVDAQRNGITHNGVTKPLKQWAKLCGITPLGLEFRLFKNYPPEHLLRPSITEPRKRVVTETFLPEPGMPTQPRKTRAGRATGQFHYRGALDTLEGHARVLGVHPLTAAYRFRKGDTVEEALSPVRKTRSDKGVSNPKRSPRYWDPTYHGKNKEVEFPPPTSPDSTFPVQTSRPID